MSLRGSRAQILHAKLPSNGSMGPVRFSIYRESSRTPLQLKGCILEDLNEFSHCATGGVAVQTLHPQERPPLQLSGCMELWLPPTLFAGLPLRLRLAVPNTFFSEGVGTCPPRLPESITGLQALRGLQVT